MAMAARPWLLMGVGREGLVPPGQKFNVGGGLVPPDRYLIACRYRQLVSPKKLLTPTYISMPWPCAVKRGQTHGHGHDGPAMATHGRGEGGTGPPGLKFNVGWQNDRPYSYGHKFGHFLPRMAMAMSLATFYRASPWPWPWQWPRFTEARYCMHLKNLN